MFKPLSQFKGEAEKTKEIVGEGEKAKEFLEKPFFEQLRTKEFAKELPGAAVKTLMNMFIREPAKFAVSLKEAPGIFMQKLKGKGVAAEQKEYKIPGMDPFKSFISEAETRFKSIEEQAVKPELTPDIFGVKVPWQVQALVPFVEVPFAALETVALAKGISKIPEVAKKGLGKAKTFVEKLRGVDDVSIQAKRYENVKTLYHGTTDVNASKIKKSGFKVEAPVHGKQIMGEGVYLTPTKAEAGTFGKNILEVNIPKDIKIKKVDPAEHWKIMQKASEKFPDISVEKAITKMLKEEGFEGMEMISAGAKGETYISIFDPKTLKTKQQLEKIKLAKAPDSKEVENVLQTLQPKRTSREIKELANKGELTTTGKGPFRKTIAKSSKKDIEVAYDVLDIIDPKKNLTQNIDALDDSISNVSKQTEVFLEKNTKKIYKAVLEKELDKIEPAEWIKTEKSIQNSYNSAKGWVVRQLKAKGEMTNLDLWNFRKELDIAFQNQFGSKAWNFESANAAKKAYLQQRRVINEFITKGTQATGEFADNMKLLRNFYSAKENLSTWAPSVYGKSGWQVFWKQHPVSAKILRGGAIAGGGAYGLGKLFKE